MTVKSMGYDHPAYTARQCVLLGSAAAGSAAASSKFVAFTNMIVNSVTAQLTTVGSSTYTLWNGTATVTSINGRSFSVIRIFNTASPGAAVALGTGTYGPYVLGRYDGTSTNTQTSIVGQTVQVPLYDTAGTNTDYPGICQGTGARQAGSNSGTGGIPVGAGDQLYVVTGTDASAVASFVLEYGLMPGANVTN